MITHNFDPVLFDFYVFQIRWYSLAYIFGIFFGWIYAKKIIKNINKNSSLNKLQSKDFDDFIIYLVIGIILGGRIGYVLIYNLSYYLKNLHEIFYIWNGGMSFHGGLLGVIFATIIFTKKRKINPFLYLDIIACVSPIGLFFGRIANFINSELYGKLTNLPWGVVFPNVGELPRHPSQIYEAILEGLVLFAILNFLALKKKLIFKTGFISICFLFLYSIFRFFSENFREPDEQLGYMLYSLTMGQLLSFITILFALTIYYKIK